MSKNILVGNGLNSALGIDGLSNSRIIERFVDVLLRSNIIFKFLFNTNITLDICDRYIVVDHLN